MEKFFAFDLGIFISMLTLVNGQYFTFPLPPVRPNPVFPPFSPLSSFFQFERHQPFTPDHPPFLFTRGPSRLPFARHGVDFHSNTDNPFQEFEIHQQTINGNPSRIMPQQIASAVRDSTQRMVSSSILQEQQSIPQRQDLSVLPKFDTESGNVVGQQIINQLESFQRVTNNVPDTSRSSTQFPQAALVGNTLERNDEKILHFNPVRHGAEPFSPNSQLQRENQRTFHLGQRSTNTGILPFSDPNANKIPTPFGTFHIPNEPTNNLQNIHQTRTTLSGSWQPQSDPTFSRTLNEISNLPIQEERLFGQSPQPLHLQLAQQQRRPFANQMPRQETNTDNFLNVQRAPTSRTRVDERNTLFPVFDQHNNALLQQRQQQQQQQRQQRQQQQHQQLQQQIQQQQLQQQLQQQHQQQIQHQQHHQQQQHQQPTNTGISDGAKGQSELVEMDQVVEIYHPGPQKHLCFEGRNIPKDFLARLVEVITHAIQGVNSDSVCLGGPLTMRQLHKLEALMMAEIGRASPSGSTILLSAYQEVPTIVNAGRKKEQTVSESSPPTPNPDLMNFVDPASIGLRNQLYQRLLQMHQSGHLSTANIRDFGLQ